MTQNIYDDDEFFAGYGTLRRSVEGLAGAGEWDSLRAMLVPVNGLRVVDLGCGYGWFCRWAADGGAASVLGIDVSERMLERARATTHDPRVHYRRGDLEAVDLPSDSFDLVYSSLTLHYLTNLDGLCAGVHETLVPGGSFVFSVEHPIFSAPTRQEFVDTPDGRTVWPLDQYLVEGPRTTTWFVDGVVKQHRTVGSYVNALVRSGLQVVHLEEWGPTDEQIAANPEWAVERQRPPFLLIAAKKPPAQRS